ncbi:MAG: Oligoendopeptidase F-like protein [Ktedonobacterales bacterium]|jgi:oligoendopeptidase F|nr:MAG: Oligoendopeptidase F-like protein [Ktedonobacterales bacterium]
MPQFASLPTTAQEISTWTWPQIAPYYDDLLARPLTADNVGAWLSDWSALSSLLDEVNTRYTIATTVNTADTASEQAYNAFLDDIMPNMMEAEQKVKQHLLNSGLEPHGFALPLRKLRADAAIYRDDNVALLSEARKLSLEYEKIAGARNVTWDGQEIPLLQLAPVLEEPDRDRRERAWRTQFARILQDTPTLAPLWRQMIELRHRTATNAGFDNYRSYRWQQMYRFDYSPDDAKRFHAAIEEAVVPAARRINDQRRQQLGVPTLRPWDRDVDPANRPPLRPYQTIDELETKTSDIFRNVSPRFAGYFETMRAEHLLDLDSRKNKAPGGYSLGFNVIGLPFIYANSVGTHEDVQTLLHEGGHAFHTFEAAPLPYLQLKSETMVPMEFAEVASMGMELLASPYLTTQYGGFYTEAQAARARVDNLRSIITFWPYMAMIDALQHWVYEHPDASADIAQTDAYWATLSDRFWPHLDWSGLEAEKRAFWHRQGHVWTDPFYYIEYGMAQLGAVQVFANSLRDPAAAVEAYRQALTLGGGAPLPDLFAAAGARFAFDADTLRSAVTLLEDTIAQLEPIAAQG